MLGAAQCWELPSSGKRATKSWDLIACRLSVDRIARTQTVSVGRGWNKAVQEQWAGGGDAHERITWCVRTFGGGLPPAIVTLCHRHNVEHVDCPCSRVERVVVQDLVQPTAMIVDYPVLLQAVWIIR